MTTDYTRRAVLGATLSAVAAEESYAQQSSLIWDSGGVNPCTRSMEWCIERFPDLSEAEKDYFLTEWERYRGVGYDPEHPLVSIIPEHDEWQWQFFGNGSLHQNIVARPSLWRPEQSRLTFMLVRVDGRGRRTEVSRPRVCRNASCRRRRAGVLKCIPPEAHKYQRRASVIFG